MKTLFRFGYERSRDAYHVAVPFGKVSFDFIHFVESTVSAKHGFHAACLEVDYQYEYNSIYADISTYVSVSTLQFITGDLPLDDYDQYLATLESIGIEKCITFMQEAYDSYMSR